MDRDPKSRWEQSLLRSVRDPSLRARLALVVLGLRRRLGSQFDELVEQGRTAILMRMVATGWTSPFDAALDLGAWGAFSSVVKDDSDALLVLMVAALNISVEIRQNRGLL